jgi:UDP-2,3-diacylglucosamine hydrolase
LSNLAAEPKPFHLGALYSFDLDPRWQRVEFISDLHLSADQPKTVAAFERYWAQTEADAVFILGDLFEVWIGDDAVQAGGFAAHMADVLSQAAAQRSVGFMAGNRDFLVGRDFLNRCGLMALADPTLINAWGHAVLLTHGDALCLSDEAYMAFRREVRTPQWRAQFLAQPLAQREQLARNMRDASQAHQRAQPPEQWADVDAAAAVAWLHQAGSADLVHGHTHRPGSEVLAPGFTRHVLSDWDVDHPPHRAQALRLTRDGFTRVPVSV